MGSSIPGGFYTGKYGNKYDQIVNDRIRILLDWRFVLVNCQGMIRSKKRILQPLISVFLTLIFCAVTQKLCNACETLPSTIHIIKEIYSQTGQLERTCEGEVAVSKCEGSCSSRVRPSAVSHSGFVKDCQCCRETSLRSREITLTKCFDPDGKSLAGEKETYTISLKEPADCRCFRCGDAISLK